MMFSTVKVSGYGRVFVRRMQKPTLIFCLLFVSLCTVFIIPVRNIVFYKAVEYAWREIPTGRLLQIHYFQDVIPDGLFRSVACYELASPTVSSSDINASMILTYPVLQNWNTTMEVLIKHHGNFLPRLNTTSKIEILYLYTVLAEALDIVKVDHFLVAGSLLGLKRHGGIIPWDDDIDISISFTEWEIVKQVLACVKGFTLSAVHHLHWKFHYTGAHYPFIDIFFYQRDDTYIWSLTYYIRKTYIYPIKYVFPLTTGTFEGLSVPIPRDALSIVKRIYDYNTCHAYKGHIDVRNKTLLKEFPCGFSITDVDCRELSYMYSMDYLGGSS